MSMTEEAFRSFYDRTARSVWGYLARLTGDPALADDLLQDAYYRFLRAGVSMKTKPTAATPSSRLRRTSPATPRAGVARCRFSSPTVRATSPRRKTWRDAFQRTTDVGRALESMKPRERAMLWLAYAEGSSHQEIAAALGVKTASVKLLLFALGDDSLESLGARRYREAGGRMMTSRIECVREDEVLMMVSTDRWPDAAPAELREHADQCQVCRELGLAAGAMVKRPKRPR